MTSKNDVGSQAVKVRKILAPDARLKAEVKADTTTSDSVQMKAATRANVDAIKAVNARAARGDEPVEKRNLAKAAIKANRVATMHAGVSRDARGESQGGVRNLRASTGATKATLQKEGSAKPNTTARKTQAQLAREKLAAAAARQAKKMQQQSQANTAAVRSGAGRSSTGNATSATRQTRASTARQSRVNSHSQTQSQPSTPKTGNQLVRVHPPKQAKSHSDVGERDSKKRPIINATALLAAKYPNYFAETNDMRTKAESRAVFVITSLIVGLIAFGWMNWNAINFQAEGEFTYNSGLIGGIIMLFILLYALRKRVKLLRKAGPMEAWYYFHLFGGVLGPLIIVFHTGFTIKSINSGVALFTMITIVLSGLFGRYIYTRIGYSLHRKLLAIKESEKQLIDLLHSYNSPASEQIERRLSNFALACLTGPRSILKLPMRLVAIRGAATACYVKASSDLSTLLKTRARQEGVAGNELKNRLSREKEQLREHIASVANIAHAHLFERILVKWRILHIPLLYILVITGLFHVLAVHMY